MSDRRNRIAEDFMEELQMLKFSLKSGRNLNFTVGTSKEEVVKCLQDALEGFECIPMDITTYIQSLSS
ncbi:hypothetical protein CPB84DRAFT_1686553 [Gymnopilus junonius]|uniref:Uncharacterized protein n=1 Tax=Gymnopilus junonius TaxID=109634 RepID=A0A9P5NDY0_GYMJU|nr:hypothetical protein CPB84DRAFT_1686553 [Gymnopilus junonius]